MRILIRNQHTYYRGSSQREHMVRLTNGIVISSYFSDWIIAIFREPAGERIAKVVIS